MKMIVIVLSIIFFSSCGTRKVNRVENIEVTKELVKEELTIDSTVKTKLVDTTKTIIEIFEPINPEQPMVINGKELKNIRFKSVSTKNGISISKTEESVLNQTKEVSNEGISESSEVIKEREGFNFTKLYILIFLLLLLFLIVWYFTKRKKDS